MPELVKNICRLLYYKHLTRLCSVAVECVSALATDPILQMHFLQVNRAPVLLQVSSLRSLNSTFFLDSLNFKDYSDLGK